MTISTRPALSAVRIMHSGHLAHTLSSITDLALVRFDLKRSRVAFVTGQPPVAGTAEAGTEDAEGTGTAPAELRLPPSAGMGRPARMERVELAPEDLVVLSRIADGNAPERAGEDAGARRGQWCAWRLVLDDGTEDLAALWLPPGVGAARVETVLETIWPVLREDCLAEARRRREEAAEDALLWLVNSKLEPRAMVIDAEGRVVRANRAARELLDEGKVLVETPRGLRCANDAETPALRKAIRRCLEDEGMAGREIILFLESADGDFRLPVGLTRYVHPESGLPMVLALLPTPPNPKRIEMLAARLGLTPAEARVAAVLRLGLPSRQAAAMLGMKVETFNTYAKRALSKLNVSCRAEMAQMLTWQAGLGRAAQ